MNRSLNTGISRIKFKNNHVVYENFVKCTVKDYEYNLSYNPTLLTKLSYKSTNSTLLISNLIL